MQKEVLVRMHLLKVFDIIILWKEAMCLFAKLFAKIKISRYLLG